MTKNEYNGWTNYETWLVKLWMDNEQPSQEYWNETARECLETARETPSVNMRLTGTEPFTVEERAAFALADRLKDQHEEAVSEKIGDDAGFIMDLMNAALSEVNWHEIAKSLLENLPTTA